MISDLAKCPCSFIFMHFMVRALPEVQNHFRKQFSHKALYIYYSYFFVSVSVRIERSKKIWFPIVFPKMDLADVRGYFHIYALKLGKTVYIATLKSLRGAYRVVCTVTYLYPRANFSMFHSGFTSYGRKRPLCGNHLWCFFLLLLFVVL